MKDGGAILKRPAREIKASKNSEKYLNCRLSKEGKCFTYKVHRLVWEAFNGPIPEGYHIDHIDGTRDNNCLDNLQCVSPKQHKQETLERVYKTPMLDQYKHFGRGMAML